MVDKSADKLVCACFSSILNGIIKRNKLSAVGVQDLIDGKRHERWKHRTSYEIIMRTVMPDYKGIKNL
jgi:hypothetical protein